LVVAVVLPEKRRFVQEVKVRQRALVRIGP